MRGKIVFITNLDGKAKDKELWGRKVVYADISEGNPAYFSYLDEDEELKTITTTMVQGIYDDLITITVRTEDEVYHIKVEDN